MKIGILQTGHAPDELIASEGDHDALHRRLLGGRGYDFETFNVVDGEFPDGPEAADGWLITGSKHGAYEDLPWIPRLEQLIRDIRDAGVPMVGICFGHQVIAQALGGKTEKFKGGWSVGRTVYKMGDRELALNAWHQDQVTEVPPGATVLGSGPMCENAVISYGDRIFTIQPHPEYSAAALHGLIMHRGKGVVPDPLLAKAEAQLSAPTDSAAVADILAEVLEKGRPA